MALKYQHINRCKYESQLQMPHPMISQAHAPQRILCLISPRDLLPLTLPSPASASAWVKHFYKGEIWELRMTSCCFTQSRKQQQQTAQQFVYFASISWFARSP